jgi:hypothetical protein
MMDDSNPKPVKVLRACDRCRKQKLKVCNSRFVVLGAFALVSGRRYELGIRINGNDVSA